MAIEVGARLAHYDVTALIGEGGMGQVYQATDTKLNRQVALKVLPEAFAADPDRRARFQREAEVLGSLNHPGITQIHGIEEQADTTALVLELVEGPTLADRIAQGPIPVDEALPIAKQIAEALEAAHEAGVIHRDLKPANIKVREDGTVKVLDFGLAKAVDPAPDGDPNQSPTLTAAATQMGVILGTAAYMSPEQAKGLPVDKRADIWALGCVVYEVLTGRRAFAGDTLAETSAAVITAEPAWGALPDTVPEPLTRLIRRCLRKDAGARLHAVADVRIELGDLLADSQASGHAETSSAVQGSATASPWNPARGRWGIAVGGLAVALMVAALGVYQVIERDVARPSADQPFTLTNQQLITDGPGSYSQPTLSPDGSTIAFVSNA